VREVGETGKIFSVIGKGVAIPILLFGSKNGKITLGSHTILKYPASLIFESKNKRRV